MIINRSSSQYEKENIRSFLFLLIGAQIFFHVNGLTTNYRIQIGPLLSTCVDACQRGCHEIRKVQAAREASDNQKLKTEVVLKDPSDPKSALTEADTAAQRAIVGSLRAEWSKDVESNDNILKIGGEEDDDDELSKSLSKATFDALDRNRFLEEIPSDESEDGGIDAKRITIFVDPLDGTREFVEGRLENCQVLVGIAIDGEAVAGAVGMPFPQGNLETEPTIIYGLDGMGTGVVGTTLTRGPFPLERNEKYRRPHHATGDSKAEVMEACRRGAIEGLDGSIVTYGGAGNKILAAALGEVTCTIQHRIGGAWDLCAPEAILKAMGGKMTDLFGEEIAIYRDDAPAHCNERGYLATPPGSGDGFHEALAAKMMSLPEVQKYKEEVENM